MKWYCKKVGDKWKIFLEQKYCKTDEEVCYGAALDKETAEIFADRLNNPLYVDDDEDSDNDNTKKKAKKTK